MKDLQSKKYWIWLSMIKGVGSKKKRNLLEIYNDPKNIYELTSKELLNISGIGEETVKKILDMNIRYRLDKYMDYMSKNEIDLISINDDEYPRILKNIYDPPISLYVKGNKNILNNVGIGIVGCRDASEYGKNVAKYFAYNLSKEEFNIISGLAKGIDSYAHIGNICANIEEKNKYSKTIAIVGNGLDTVYPKENEKVFNKILDTEGTIISEYPLGTKPEKMNFPARNRIISGMSKAVLVVEAKEKSGTLITVDFALEQGKDVLVVPGNINSLNSVGTNELIKQGAKLVTTYKDVVDLVNS